MSGRSSPLIRRFRKTSGDRYAMVAYQSHLFLLRSLRAVLRPPLSATVHTFGIERPTDNVIAHTRKVLNATAADEHHRMLLEVVPFPRDVRRDLLLIGQTDARDFAESGVRLLRRHRPDLGADTALLWRPGTACDAAFECVI